VRAASACPTRRLARGFAFELRRPPPLGFALFRDLCRRATRVGRVGRSPGLRRLHSGECRRRLRVRGRSSRRVFRDVDRREPGRLFGSRSSGALGRFQHVSSGARASASTPPPPAVRQPHGGAFARA
jgi:hypothetical protein